MREDIRELEIERSKTRRIRVNVSVPLPVFYLGSTITAGTHKNSRMAGDKGDYSQNSINPPDRKPSLEKNGIILNDNTRYSSFPSLSIA
jgi:hypothetical protein